VADPGNPQDGPPTGEGAFQRVERIFFEVAALAPRDRDEAIVRLCAGDGQAEAQVRALVASAARIGSFLEQPVLGRGLDQVAQEAGIQEPEDDLIGATVGSFRILRRIASGGMGTVYLAARSDGQFDQTVAIKIVKRGLDTEEILRRFRAERQTLAALDHPNIARLLDGGITPDGRPFLVMEYVDGKPIDTYCDEHRLPVRDRLGLFRAACEAVHHAHGNLVIHRDLKPSNILVTPQGVPKLLDFGISKVLRGGTTTQQLTADTDRRLTPEYASPEQVEGGSMTTAADVYSLGVVLYELLTGSRPYSFNARTNEEWRRVVCSVVPPPPSAAVTVRASRKRTTARAQGATADGPPSEVPPAGEAGAAPVNVPATRGVSSTRLRNQLRGDLDTIVLMALRKEPHRRYASAEQFAADIGRYLDGMPVQAQRDTLAYRASKFVRRHPVGVTVTIAVIAALTGATVVLSRQANRLQRQRDELLATNKRLDETRRYLQTVISGAESGNQGPDARLGTVLKDAATALETSPPADRLTRAAAEQSLGRAVMSLGMLPEARRLLQSAEQGFAFLPETADARVDIRLDLAELLFFEGKHAEAEARFREILANERAAIAGAHTELEGVLLNDLGTSLRLQGKVDESIATHREAIRARSAALGPETLAVAESRNNLASALFQKGQLDEAIDEFERALAVRRALLRPDHPLIVRLGANLGLAKLRAGRVDDAVVMLTGAAEAWDSAFGPDHPGRVATITSLSMALRQQGRQADAIAWLRRALEWQRTHQPDNSPQIAATEANIAIALAEQHDDVAAEEILIRVLPVLRSAGGGSATILKTASEALAAIYERTSRPEQARTLRDQPAGQK
jgi:eukaryotic-like serine/threonine-protein kinase